MERKIGEIFEYEGRKLMVVEEKSGCGKNCFFYNKPCSLLLNIIGICCGRTDKKYVIFIKQPQELNLCEILKNCPRGFKLYSLTRGEVTFCRINKNHTLYPIEVEVRKGIFECYSPEGKIFKNEGECILVPSKDQRDWSKFTAPWYKKEKFDPNTLQPFNKVLVSIDGEWQCDFFSHMLSGNIFNKRCMGIGDVNVVIPYNDDTKHLIGTTNEAPEYYRYWEH